MMLYGGLGTGQSIIAANVSEGFRQAACDYRYFLDRSRCSVVDLACHALEKAYRSTFVHLDSLL